MKSKELYSYIDEFIAGDLKAAGFKKYKSAVPCYFKMTSQKILYVYIKIGKYSWEPQRGGEFSITSYLANEGDERHDYNSIGGLYTFYYADDRLKQRIIEQNINVYKKIESLDVESLVEEYDDPDWLDFLKESHASSIQSMAWDVESDRQWVTINKALYYLDRNDVKVWSKIIVDLITTLNIKVENGVIHSDH